MRACLGSLRIFVAQQPGLSLKLERTNTGAYRWVAEFMFYAYHAELEDEDQQTQAILLEKLDCLIKTHKNGGLCHWIANFFPNIRDLDFLNLAAIYGLRSYIASKLHQYDASQLETIAIDLLRHLNPPDSHYRLANFPLPKPDMVAFLKQARCGSRNKRSCIKDKERYSVDELERPRLIG